MAELERHAPRKPPASKPRLLVVGAKGFVGAHVMAAADDRFERISAGRSGCVVTVDVTDAESVRSAFARVDPDLVMLAAALADIDRCENEPELARAINVEGAHNVVRECARRSARLLFVSTAAVFDGEAERYTEESRTNPLSVYGKTKGIAEWLIRAALPGAVIARLSLVLGPARQAPSNALVDKLRVSFEAGQTVSVPAGEYRNAIDVATACRWLLDLAAAPVARGVFHLGSSDAMSRYEIVRTLAEAMGYPAERVVHAIPAAGRAPRGRHHLLVPGRVAVFSEIPVPTCRQAIERCVHAVA